MDKINNLRNSFDQDIKDISSIDELNNLQIKYLGRNGLVNQTLQELKNMPSEERRDFGKKLNELKKQIEVEIISKQEVLAENAAKNNWTDVTLPGKKYPKGSLHPVSYAIEEITDIFKRIGFIQMSYPEVEWEYFSFDALNMPATHPARDDFESVFVEGPKNPKYGRLVLSPHTSSGQVREMLRVKTPPIRMINIAKCYRLNWDATHAPMFYQFEGLCVDRNINITHLKGTLDYFAKEFFGRNRKTRLRPFHFQFTEPSFETDITCGICDGTGEINGQKCKVCKSGWMELGGAGMVHPNVLRAGGIDPDEYSGWAFGFGPERCLMMKLDITDIRNLYSGDIRFLEQF